jgi:hypothetical protein
LRKLLKRFGTLTVVENNVNGELADLLRQVTLRDPDRLITRKDGRPMHVSELTSRIRAEVFS